MKEFRDWLQKNIEAYFLDTEGVRGEWKGGGENNKHLQIGLLQNGDKWKPSLRRCFPKRRRYTIFWMGKISRVGDRLLFVFGADNGSNLRAQVCGFK